MLQKQLYHDWSEITANMLEKESRHWDRYGDIDIFGYMCKLLTCPFQPLEVTKTTMAANRADGFAGSIKRVWGRGGVFGCKSPVTHLPRSIVNEKSTQSTKVSSPGPGSKPPPKAPSSSSLPLKPNTTPKVSAPPTLYLESVVVWLVALPKPTQQWVSALA